MSRYIDAEALERKYMSADYMDNDTACDVIAEIDTAPHIDIVRCKECLYWRAYETWSECERWTDDPYESAKTKADDFCSYGEREGE